MFLSEWREFPSTPCLAGKETSWQLASRFCWNRERPWYTSELVSFLVGLRTYQHISKIISSTGLRGSAVGWGTPRGTRRSMVRFNMASLDFYWLYLSGHTKALGSNHPLKRNKYKEYLLGVQAACLKRLTTLPNKRAERPQNPQALRSSLGLHRDCLTLYFIHLDSYTGVSLWFTCDKILYLRFERNSNLPVEKVQ